MHNIIKTSLTALIIVGSFLIFSAQAKAECFWMEKSVFYDSNLRQTVTQGGCSDIQEIGVESLCEGTKPTYAPINGVAKSSVCCCDRNSSPQVASDSVCSWEKQIIDQANPQGTQCSSGKSQFPDNNCSQEKPNYSSNNINSYEKAICCCQTNTIAQVIPRESPKYSIPELQVKIPGLDSFSKAGCTQKANGSYNCSIPWIGEYIQAIYNYAFAVAGILAAIMLMAGGLIWLTSGGDSGKVGQAKTIITSSIIGLVILFSSYLILYQINPDLVELKPINIALPESSQNDTENPGATSQEFYAGDWLWDTGINLQIGDASPELISLLNCMRPELYKGVGRISSISDSNHIGTLTDCESSCSGNNCAHSCGSCHYGGGLGTNKSYAVDFGDEENITELTAAAQKCNAGFILDEVNHLHVSVNPCPKK